MTAGAKYIVDFLMSRCTYIIPVYQRNYDWKTENCKRLLHDIIKAETTNLTEYFLGSLVTVQKSENSRQNLYIIDGQQRITSLTLLLLAIYHTDINRQSEINRMIFSDIQSEEKSLILKQIQKDEINLSKILKNGKLQKEDSNIINNYLFFLDYVQNNQNDIQLIMNGLNRLRFVHIELSKSDKPQLVFETLNATGKELSEADKIRNFILMYEDQEHLYENYWVKIEQNCQQNINANNVSSLMKAFLTIEHRSSVVKPIKDNNVYQVFKEYCDTSRLNNKEILFLIDEYSQCYHKILKPEDYSAPYIQSLKNIKELELTALNPLILALLKLEQNQQLSPTATANIISFLECYLVRRGLCEVPSNALNKVTFGLIPKILSVSGGIEIRDILELILIELKGTARFPNNDEVITALKTKALYKTRLLGRFILKTLEYRSSKEKNDVTDITIEHIMPQKLSNQWIENLGENYSEIHEQYLHTLGNLTFTGYNSELGNAPFSEKLETLSQSKFHFLNEEFRKKPTPYAWSKNEILARTQRLAKFIMDIYPYPSVQASYDTFDLFDDNEDLTYREIVYFEYNATKYTVRDNTWAYFMMDFIKLLYEEDPVKFQQIIMDNIDFSSRKLSWESHPEWGPVETGNKLLYINTVSNTNSKIAMLKKTLELLDLSESPVTLYLKSL